MTRARTKAGFNPHLSFIEEVIRGFIYCFNLIGGFNPHLSFIEEVMLY